MIDLISDIIKLGAIIVCSFYVFVKLSRQKLKWTDLVCLPLLAGFGVGGHYLRVAYGAALPVYLYACSVLLAFIKLRKPIYDVIVISVVSFGISSLFYLLASLVYSPFSYLLYNFILKEESRKLVWVIFVALIQLLLTFLILKIKRFRGGISPYHSKGSFDLLLLLSLLCIFGMTVSYLDTQSILKGWIIMLLIIIFAFGLLFFWRRHITNAYQEQVQKRNVEILENSVSAYKKQVEELKRHNDELANIIHRDNKLIAALKQQTEELAVTSLSDTFTALADDRETAVESYLNFIDPLPKTHNDSVDAILKYLYNNAEKQGAKLSLLVEENAADEFLQKMPDTLSVCTLLSDLGTNALIALKNRENAKLKITLGTDKEGLPFLSFADNGAHFDEAVIAKFGIERTTTHAAEHGSGRGLMTTFEILQKFNASFVLDETLPSSDYVKTVTVCWNQPNRIVIKTARESLLRVCSARADITCIGEEQKEE